MNVYKTAHLCDEPVAWTRPLRVGWQAGLRSWFVFHPPDHHFTKCSIGVADWPYGHRVGGEQTSYRPMLAQLFWSNLHVTRRRQRR